MKSNIAIIGFMGVGKTAVGEALAERLGREFIELDSVIRKKAGKSIADIFLQDDEIRFRELEIEAVKQVCKNDRVVISCGGGVVLNLINIERLRQKSMIVYLAATPSVILKRIGMGGERRPLLEVPDPADTARALLKFRRPLYEHAADIRIDTTRMNVTQVVDAIISELHKDESFDF